MEKAGTLSQVLPTTSSFQNQNIGSRVVCLSAVCCNVQLIGRAEENRAKGEACNLNLGWHRTV